MKNWLAGFWCKLRGHRRGVRVAAADGVVTYRCPRCWVTHTRKVKA